MIAHGGKARTSLAIEARRKSPIDSRNRFETKKFAIAKNES